jgi:hypothetical protein
MVKPKDNNNPGSRQPGPGQGSDIYDAKPKPKGFESVFAPSEKKFKERPAGADSLFKREVIVEVPVTTPGARPSGLGDAPEFEVDESTLTRFKSPVVEASMPTFDAPPETKKPLRQSKGYNWSTMTVAELVKFRDEINQALPPTELSKLNLEQEALLQYRTLRELQANVLQDDEVPANQRAQVANAVAANLKTLGDQQQALYTTERFKLIENLLIKCLTMLPEEQAAAFIAEYEKAFVREKLK